ncbi:predicted protein, partial [Thalassiosira pseudonana CCMP1335]
TAIKLLVSNNSSGCIIGRSGKTISELQADSSTRIKLSQGGDYYPGTQDRVCLIQGSLDNARVAVEMILLKLLQVESIVNEFGSVAMPFTIQVLVPTPSCGMLIGRGGSNIKSIKEESGVSFIQLSQKEQDNNHTANAIMSNTAINTAATTSERIITISGCFESCVKCVLLILEEMASNPEVSRYMNMTTSYSKVVAAQQSAATAQSSHPPSLSAPTHSIQFGIPESMVGFVLGRRGKTLTQLQEQSQTRIRLSQRGVFLPGTNQRVLTITGNTAEHVANAQYLINQRLSEKGSSRR